MQFLAQILAKLLFCLGIMITAVSCVLGSVVGSGAGGAPLFGIAIMRTGAVLWHRRLSKICPACSERVKYQASTCQRCGAQIAG